MTKAFPLILLGILLIAFLDTIGSIASRKLKFNYTYLLPLSSAIYIGIPFLVRKRFDRKAAITAAVVLGIFDATVGFKI